MYAILFFQTPMTTKVDKTKFLLVLSIWSNLFDIANANWFSFGKKLPLINYYLTYLPKLYHLISA